MNTGFIYKLCCSDVTVTEEYVGSTKSIRNRLSGHRTSCQNSNDKHYDLYVYKYIREHGGFENWDLIVLEEIKFTEKHELRARERHWIETLSSTLNTKIPTRTREEWMDLHREEVLQRQREYHHANKEEIHKKKQEYYLTNAEEIKAKSREYRDADPKRTKEKDRQKYLRCQDRIKAYRSEKLICECGMEYTRTHGDRHRRTAKHLALLTKAQTNPQPDIVVPASHDNEQPGTEAIQQVSQVTDPNPGPQSA